MQEGKEIHRSLPLCADFEATEHFHAECVLGLCYQLIKSAKATAQSFTPNMKGGR